MTDVQRVADSGDGPDPIPAEIETFNQLAEAWRLSADEQIKLLGSLPRSTFFRFKKEGGAVPRDTMERISHLFGIWKALQILLPEPEAADAWVKIPNAYFHDRTALDVMLDGGVADIFRVRQYLDAQRGG